MKEALYFIKHSDNAVQCQLCPHNCIIRDGKSGICNARYNKGGILYSSIYEKPCAVHVQLKKSHSTIFYPEADPFLLARWDVISNVCTARTGNCQQAPLTMYSVKHLPLMSVFH